MAGILGNSMKKLLCICAAALALAGCGKKEEETGLVITSAVEPVSEPADMRDYQWHNDEEPPFLEITPDESMRFFDEGGTGLLYFGRSNCPYCQRAVPELDAVLNEYGISVYYVDVDLSKLTYEKYEELLPYLDTALAVSESGEKNFLIPNVIAVKEGKIIGNHISLVDDFEFTSGDAQLDDKQKETLRDIYRDLIISLAD